MPTCCCSIIPENSPLMDHAEHILSSAERAANLTRSLLAFSRKQVISPKPVDLNEVVTGLDGLLRRLIGEDIELRATLTRQDVIVMADSGQIEQVLINLCTNARDAMPAGGKLSIGISTVIVKEQSQEHRHRQARSLCPGDGVRHRQRHRRTDQGKDLRALFYDEGNGKGDRAGSFHRLRNHQAAQRFYHGPERAPTGTTFKLYLPLVGTAGTGGLRPAAPRPRGGTEVILVAEDDGEVRKLIRLVLSRKRLPRHRGGRRPGRTGHPERSAGGHRSAPA